MGQWSRRLAPTFLERAQVSTGLTLDVGCGAGALSQALIDRSIHSVVGIDPSAEYVAYASSHVAKGTSRVCFLVGDATALPFAATTFDTAVLGLFSILSRCHSWRFLRCGGSSAGMVSWHAPFEITLEGRS